MAKTREEREADLQKLAKTADGQMQLRKMYEEATGEWPGEVTGIPHLIRGILEHVTRNKPSSRSLTRARGMSRSSSAATGPTWLKRSPPPMGAGDDIGDAAAGRAPDVKDRLERSGMRWTKAGAQAMLDVGSEFLNGDWENLQAHRIATETERMYPHREVLKDMAWPLVA